MRLAVTLLLASCSSSDVDTCSDGETFDALHLANGLEQIGGAPGFRIQWTTPTTGPGALLPAAYFTAPSVTGADSASGTGPNEITVVIGDIASHLHGNTLEVDLDFADRRDFIACHHPGQDDHYQLAITISLSADHQTIVNSTFVENVTLGAI